MPRESYGLTETLTVCVRPELAEWYRAQAAKDPLLTAVAPLLRQALREYARANGWKEGDEGDGC